MEMSTPRRAFHTFRWRRPFMAAAVLLSCGSGPPVDGLYQFEASIITTSRAAEGECGAPGLPNGDFDATFIVSAVRGARVDVTERVTGCTFEARVEGDQIVAREAACEIAETAEVRRRWGLYRKVYHSFLIDRAHSAWQARWVNWAGESNPQPSCAAGEGRLVRHERARSDA